eukprot:6848476-Prymnesium_polylepis.1
MGAHVIPHRGGARRLGPPAHVPGGRRPATCTNTHRLRISPHTPRAPAVAPPVCAGLPPRAAIAPAAPPCSHPPTRRACPPTHHRTPARTGLLRAARISATVCHRITTARILGGVSCREER